MRHHPAGLNGRARRTIACALVLVFTGALMQCAHARPGAGEQPPLLPQPPAADSRVFKDCPGCPDMVEIPGGTFRMGLADWYTNSSVQPAHDVTLRPFAIGLREVTRDEYAVFAESTGRDPSCTGYYPGGTSAARCLTWYDAQAYAEWLGSRTGRPYRLPSESEWEYVARGSDIEGTTRFGVQDLFTGVREWTADCHFINYQGAPTDGSAWADGPGCLPRVIRGHAGHQLWMSPRDRWTDRQKRIHIERYAARRRWRLAHRTTSWLGMRLARDLVGSSEP